MGLDISSYRKVEFVKPYTKADEDFYGDGLTLLVVNGDFPERADGLATGWYRTEGEIHHRAGSYSGYGRWREELAKMVGVDLMSAWQTGTTGLPGEPFLGLLNFSDCEGVIGPNTSARLYADFRKFEAVAMGHESDLDDWFFDAYANWTRAFRNAKDGGAVEFH